MFNKDNNEGCNKFWDIWIDTCYLFHGDAYVAFYGGLSSFQLYRDTEDTMWLDSGRQCLAEMKRFSDQGLSLNFHQKVLLMEAEEYYCNDNNVCAQLCCDKAIAATKMHRFIIDEALAYKRAAIFYFETNKTRESLEHFKLAYEKYHTWGALGKCNDISKTIKENFDEAVETSSTVSSSNILCSIHKGDEGFSSGIDPRKRWVM
jgi:tetratricopeptide (TPR) repeat protein